MRLRALPNASDPEGVEKMVRAEYWYVFGEGVRGKDAVERVEMTPGQAARAQGRFCVNWNQRKAGTQDVFGKVPFKLSRL